MVQLSPPSILPRVPHRSAHVLKNFDTSHCLPPVQRFFADNRVVAQQYLAANADGVIVNWFIQHFFRFVVEACDDGRLAELAEMLGFPYEALVEAYRDAGNLHNDHHRYPVYRQRVERTHEKCRNTIFRTPNELMIPHRMCTIHLVIVHHSWMYPDTHSCAAIKNDTPCGVAAAHKQADRLNAPTEDRGYRGNTVAIPVKLDTDFGSMVIYGPNGEFDVREYAGSLPGGHDLRSAMLAHLHHIFPSTWAVLTALPTECRNAFYEELVERLMCNLVYYQRKKREGKTPEALDHQEDLIVIGGPSLAFDSVHNFCVEAREIEIMLKNVAIGLIFDGLHNALRAMERNDRAIQIPILTCALHDPDTKELETAQMYGHLLECGTEEDESNGLTGLIRAAIQPKKDTGERQIVDTILHKIQLKTGHPAPTWVVKQLYDLPDLLHWTHTTMDRSTRQALPVY